MKLKTIAIFLIAACAATVSLSAQNPIIKGQFSADPSAHVFNGRVYVYPSHDIPAPADYARKDWFCMADYHVYSSDNLVDWVDHGVIVDQWSVPWVNAAGYSMWAPDCNYHNGKYYFYFPAPQKPREGVRGGNGIGVAISDTPYGPFIPEEQPIQGIGGIDPCIFIDDDGTPYLAWSGRGLQVARLKDNMLELDSEPVTISGIPRGMTEGPFLFKRNGKYYYTFPWVEDARETLAYCMADNPLGPYEFKGKFMEQSETICWTNHHSFIELDGQWYLFYHHNDYSPYFDKNRSVCIDYLYFNPDGTIQMVTPTLRGVGTTKATSLIQIDRYSNKSEQYVAVDFLNSEYTFDGWKAILWNTTQETEPRWISYDRVDFGQNKLNTATIRVHSLAGGKIELRADALDGPVLASFNVPGEAVWAERTVQVSESVRGVHNLYLLMTDGNHVEVDWVNFK
ncbi:MAG: family 43 glycosylhydrolase [Bacteroidales bacterium]|nr:family 43 glycosylhydrolase [Bacteroidales bacterium]MBP5537950.1 family 43 glycosylhydrolase [Bacteroidales bacterium]